MGDGTILSPLPQRRLFLLRIQLVLTDLVAAQEAVARPQTGGDTGRPEGRVRLAGGGAGRPLGTATRGPLCAVGDGVAWAAGTRPTRPVAGHAS